MSLGKNVFTKPDKQVLGMSLSFRSNSHKKGSARYLERRRLVAIRIPRIPRIIRIPRVTIIGRKEA